MRGDIHFITCFHKLFVVPGISAPFLFMVKKAVRYRPQGICEF